MTTPLQAADNYWEDLERNGWQLGLDRHTAVAWLLTECRADPYDYPLSWLGFDQYLRDSGITRFTAPELCAAKYPDCAAKHLGARWDVARQLMPSRWVWPRAAACCGALERVREASGGPAIVHHWWRPEPYNTRCAKSQAIHSDHITACAIDVELASPAGYARALRDVIRPLYRADVVGLSVGYHSRGQGVRLHLGVLAPATIAQHAQRWWDYATGRSGHGQTFPG